MASELAFRQALARQVRTTEIVTTVFCFLVHLMDNYTQNSLECLHNIMNMFLYKYSQ
jgi:hypothetical protein